MEILVCPVCKGKLEYIKKKSEMRCHHDGLAYPVRSGIPILLEFDSREIESNKNKNSDL